MKKIIFTLGILILAVAGLWFFFRQKYPPLIAPAPQTESGTAPAVDLFPEDSDRDGIPSEKERELGLNPTEFDTDGDGLSDYNELTVWKTDPKKEDTDGDGFLDGSEVFDGYNPNGPGKL